MGTICFIIVFGAVWNGTIAHFQNRLSRTFEFRYAVYGMLAEFFLVMVICIILLNRHIRTLLFAKIEIDRTRAFTTVIVALFYIAIFLFPSSFPEFFTGIVHSSRGRYITYFMFGYNLIYAFRPRGPQG